MLLSLRQPKFPAAMSVPHITALDVARGMAMVIVLYGHALEVFFEQRPDGRFFEQAFVQYKASAGFAMAVFFMVSGAAAAGICAKTWRSVVRTSLFLIALAYLVHFLGVFLHLAQSAVTGGDDFERVALYGLEAALKGRGFSTVVIWFLVSLAVVRLIVYALFKTLTRPQAFIAVIAIALSSVFVPYIPNAFMAKTWSIGVAFFALGMAVAPHVHRLTRTVALPLLLMLPLSLWLALQNRGCPYDLWASCPLPQLGNETAVWVPIGAIGFIPLYWAAALTGSIGVLSLAALLMRTKLAGILSYIGARTMGLLIINGFVLVFLQPWLKEIPLPRLPVAAFPVLLIGVVVFHLVALRALRRPLHALNKTAMQIADAALVLSERTCSRIAASVPARQLYEASTLNTLKASARPQPPHD
jgi:hypothetical protein